MKKGTLQILLCYFLWGILPVFWKLLAGLGSLYLLASRVLWSFLFAAGILALERQGGTVRAIFRSPREWGVLLAAGVFAGVNWGSYLFAVNSGHLLDASLAYYMNPVLAILLGTLVFHEKLTGLQWLSVGVTAGGLAVTMARYGRIPWLALVIGGSFAVYGAIKKKVSAPAPVSLFFETLTLLPAAAAYLLWAGAQGTGAAGVLSGWQWLLLPAAGVVTAGPLMLYAAGIRTTPMTLSGILMYLNPTLQLLLSVLVYHETFTATHAILFCFVWTGLILYLLSDAMQRRRQHKEELPCA